MDKRCIVITKETEVYRNRLANPACHYSATELNIARKEGCGKREAFA